MGRSWFKRNTHPSSNGDLSQRKKNLRDRLVHGHLEKQKTQISQTTVIGSHKCGPCKACSYMPTMKEFINPVDDKKYQIWQFLNYTTEGVMYVAKCSCPLFYMGKMIRQLRRRVLQHIGSIRTAQETPLSQRITIQYPILGDPERVMLTNFFWEKKPNGSID